MKNVTYHFHGKTKNSLCIVQYPCNYLVLPECFNALGKKNDSFRYLLLKLVRTTSLVAKNSLQYSVTLQLSVFFTMLKKQNERTFLFHTNQDCTVIHKWMNLLLVS